VSSVRTDATPRWPSALALDAALVLAFAALGRRSHDEGGSAIGGAISVAAPFLIALGAAWLIPAVRRRPRAVVSGATVCAVTLIVGMVVRRTVFDRGTALSFVIVATCVLAAFLIGWRVVALTIRRRTTRHA
jgi:F0F1-type ATP synthase assembly protein I